MSVWTVELTDLATDETLADLSNVFESASVTPRANKLRTVSVTVPGKLDAIRGTAPDGDRILATMARGLKIRRDDALWGHTRLWDLDGGGVAAPTSVVLTGYDPMVQLLARPVRDATGDLTKPDFSSPISGGTMIKQAIENSVTYEGPLPIDTTSGDFDETVPPAADLAAQLTDWPITIGALIALLTKTGLVEVVMDPVDTSMGFPPGVLVKLSVRNRAGADLSGSVHFDYGTGDHSVEKFRFTESGGDPGSGVGLCNKLWYELGPRHDQQHWDGNITATETTPVDLSAFLALEEASRDKYGVFMDIKIFESDFENTFRPMWHNLWKREVRYRVVPLQRCYITPHAGVAPDPLADYDIFDTVAINAADIVGNPEFVNASQRVYEYTATKQGSDSVERVSELITMADDEDAA